MNNRAASERKTDFSFTGMKVNAITLARPALRYHCLRRDVGGWATSVRNEVGGKERGAEDRAEPATTVPLIL